MKFDPSIVRTPLVNPTAEKHEDEIEEIRQLLKDLHAARDQLAIDRAEQANTVADAIAAAREQNRVLSEERIEVRAKEIADERTTALTIEIAALKHKVQALEDECITLRAAKRRLREALDRAREGDNL